METSGKATLSNLINLVSVIIPAHKAALYLPTAVECASGKTGPPAEIIIVSDGSTDKTALFAAVFASRCVDQENQNAPSFDSAT